ncbi:MAG: hypothetical protein IJX31_02050 [Clostridia bacterium]|nr:hypothetical protein [Clostridia bacterium]
MYKNLRIIFTILSAICLAAAIPLGIFFDFVGIISAALGAGIFFVLMLLFKQSQEFAEAKQKKALSVSPEQNDKCDGAHDNAKNEQKPPQNNVTSPTKKTHSYKRKKK